MIRHKVNFLRKFRIFLGGNLCQQIQSRKGFVKISETGTQVTESGEGVQIRSKSTEPDPVSRAAWGLAT